MLFTAIACCAFAQVDSHSTKVNDDGRVTFTYRNDKAKSVLLDVQFSKRVAMIKNMMTGLWSVTLGPAAPDMYPYCFVVDGVSNMDPECDQWFPNEGFKNSLLDIPGKDAPLVHSIQQVPHGNVNYVTYYSSAIGAYNNAIVYTPPTYEKDKDKAYPVFYLISGTTDTEEVYYKVGRMNYIADNLIAQGAAKEMIIVLPYGNPTKLVPNANPMQMGDAFSKDLIGDLMPYVEANFRTINDRDHRAIGGFSRGGNQALSNGLTHLDKFSYLCSYSSFTSTTLPDVYDNADDTNSKIHLFWLGVGTDDFLYGTARDYTEFLDQKGIRAVKEYTSDKFGHTWMNAKYFLDKTMRLLFNPEASAQAMSNAQPTKAKTGDEQQFTPGVMARLFPKPLVSPEFGERGTVTFRIKAEKAEHVLLEGEMLASPVPMQRDSDGVWSVTLKDIDPDVYCYSYDVDGTRVADAQCMYLAPEHGFKRSILNMPGAPYSVNDHKSAYSPVTYHATHASDGTLIEYAEVIPSVKRGKLPVITLVTGPDYSFESWIKIAHAPQILDQMIASGKCRPCMLRITSQPADAKSISLNSADYKTWAEARKALVKTLEKVK